MGVGADGVCGRLKGYRPTAQPLVAGVGRQRRVMRLAGRVGRAGDAVNPSMEACQPHPCGRHPRATYPPDPLTVSVRGQPRRRKRRARAKAEAGRFARIHAWRGSTVSTKIDTYQSGMPFRQFAGICRRRGGSGCGGVRGMGPRHASGGLGRTPNPGLAVCAGKRTRASRGQGYRDVLAPSPATGPTPPSHGYPAFAVAVAPSGCRAASPAGKLTPAPTSRPAG